MSSSPSSDWDLSKAADVKLYLATTPFAATSVLPLSGGYSNFVYRLVLQTPYEGRTTLVLKHGKDHLPGSDKTTLHFDLVRQIFEVEAMNWIHTWISPDALVTTPKVHCIDETAHCVLMDDAGEGSTTLKQFILDGQCDTSVAKDIGHGLGAFLARMHARGAAPEEDRARRTMDTNEQGKRLSAWVTHGRTISTLSGADGLEALEKPTLGIAEEDLQLVADYTQQTSAAIMNSKETIVQGDFWPGNMLLTLDNTGKLKRITVVDWELVKLGIPGYDLGQFFAETHLLRRFHPRLDETVSVLEYAFKQAYAKEAGLPSVEADEKLNRDMLVQQAVHLITWTVRIRWGEREAMRAVVMEGFRQLKSCIKSIPSGKQA
ncbi:hypothetical protein CYLTODRAFT_426815 [Cylindrobasidium torrendii FP15055 ss-10]|uniref:Aminoglycoside phosphotransferase domain-containing protein n=1 Tax=Cylindrobasidium torrendii FP15055 ss-10 TaxID=1314674 RepID=A0A0D7AXG7_9AGAR|nr:hypothetical protein CYLTODRAFT_426815 [Cylindrobasidium torrendii FP15055 ss-10]